MAAARGGDFIEEESGRRECFQLVGWRELEGLGTSWPSIGLGFRRRHLGRGPREWSVRWWYLLGRAVIDCESSPFVWYFSM